MAVTTIDFCRTQILLACKSSKSDLTVRTSTILDKPQEPTTPHLGALNEHCGKAF